MRRLDYLFAHRLHCLFALCRRPHRQSKHGGHRLDPHLPARALQSIRHRPAQINRSSGRRHAASRNSSYRRRTNLPHAKTRRRHPISAKPSPAASSFSGRQRVLSNTTAKDEMERIQRLMPLNHIPTNNVALKEKRKLDEETEKSPQSSLTKNAAKIPSLRQPRHESLTTKHRLSHPKTLMKPPTQPTPSPRQQPAKIANTFLNPLPISTDHPIPARPTKSSLHSLQ